MQMKYYMNVKKKFGGITQPDSKTQDTVVV